MVLGSSVHNRSSSGQLIFHSTPLLLHSPERTFPKNLELNCIDPMGCSSYGIIAMIFLSAPLRCLKRHPQILKRRQIASTALGPSVCRRIWLQMTLFIYLLTLCLRMQSVMRLSKRVSLNLASLIWPHSSLLRLNYRNLLRQFCPNSRKPSSFQQPFFGNSRESGEVLLFSV